MNRRVSWLRIMGRIFLILVILLIAAGFGGSYYFKKLIDKSLKEYVISASDSLYRLEYDNLSMNLYSGSLSMDNMKLIPDTTVFQKMTEQNRAPRMLASGEIRSFRVRNFLWWKFIRTKSLISKAIILDGPQISLKRIRNPKQDAIPPFDLMQMLSREITNLEIGSVFLNKATVDYEFVDKVRPRRALLHLEKLDLFIDKLYIDSVKNGDSSRSIFANNYLMKLENYRYRTPDSLYWLVWKDIEFNSLNNRATIDSFSIEPRYKEKDFWQRAKIRKERFEMNLKEITLEGVNANTLINEGELKATSMTISGGSWQIFQNMSLPLPPVKKNVCFSQKLMALDFPFNIDTIRVSDVNLHFKQFEPKTEHVGHLTFDNIRGRFLNVTNVDADIKENPEMKISLAARFMDVSTLSADFYFLLNAPDGKFRMRAELDRTNASRLNRASVPLAKLEIENGTINKLIYHASGNDRYATGNVEFLYDDLKLNFLEPDNEDGTLEKQGLKSFLAALFIVRQQNPGKGKDPRRATNITTFRHPRKGYFNMIWRTLFEGMKEIIVVTNTKNKPSESKRAKKSKVK